jgi:hypothetical protein
MKNNLYKKMIAVGMSIAFIPFFQLYSSSATDSETTNIQLEYSYIEQILPKYLKAHDVANADIYISNSFDVYNNDIKMASDADTYVVFEEDDVIGLLSVNYIDGTFHSSFEFGEFEDIQNYYDCEKEVAFISSNEKMSVEPSTKKSSIEREDISVDFSSIEKDRRIPCSVQRGTTSHYYRKNISVPIVPNAISPAGQGLCWAASIASKYDYLTGNNLVAIDIYNALDELYDGTPIGIALWEARAFSHLNMSYTHLTRMLDCSEILPNIQANNPIYIGVSRSGGAHALLLCGITFYTDGTGLYRVMDPNRTVYVDIAVSEDTMNGDDQLTYVTTYGYTYTSWYDSWY